ncbi:MAG TPA: hypothetical protein VLT45_01785 [Kofleriaceae bacterium]|nr:hypothetical protein [Kofleriaceae bacterium]
MNRLLLLCFVLGACGSSDTVSSDEQARRAYLGLDKSIGKSITLGFDGFNSASSANISPQTAMGDKAGMLTVTGQVDQGASANKGMRLYVGMVGYTDGPIAIDDKGHTINVTYDTAASSTDQPYLQMMLMNIPTGTLTGTLNAGTTMTGKYHLTGDIKGDVELDLTITGKLMSGPNNTVVRVPGMTHVTGTAVSGDGMYAVDVTI